MPKGKQQSAEGKAMWIKGTIDGYSFLIASIRVLTVFLANEITRKGKYRVAIYFL